MQQIFVFIVGVAVGMVIGTAWLVILAALRERVTGEREARFEEIEDEMNGRLI